MVLATLIDLDGTGGWISILMPLVVLAVVVVGVVTSRDRAAHDPVVAVGHGGSQFPDDVPAGSALMKEGREIGHPSSLRTHAHLPTSLKGTVTSPPPDVSDHGASMISGEDESRPWALGDHNASHVWASSALESELIQAEQRFDDAAVARLSLQLARDLIAGGTQCREAQTHLRRAIILAARLKDDETHASARLELGDLMRAEGDLTSACEHWQIARQIYWDGNAIEELADVDRRMMANGCPTDWVLNDF